MPASSVKEDSFLAPAVGYARADDPALGRGAPATRYRVRIVNTGADRVYVAYSTTTIQQTTPPPEVIEADFGVWESFVDANQAIYVRASGASNVYLNMKQFAT
jgi:hypothetical protein